MPSIALLTDFGFDDHYVGVLHAVLEREAPGVPRIDLGHGLAAGGIWDACFHLRCVWSHLPADGVVLAVVDPGVGSSRRAVAVRIGDRSLVAPDNGVAASVGPAREAVVLDWRRMGLVEPSATFHGRDLFAPAAARVATGGAIAGLGEGLEVSTLMPCPLPVPRIKGDRIEGIILSVDRFGNLVTNVLHEKAPEAACAIWRADRRARRVRTYADGEADEVVVLEGSAGYLELAVNCGSAAELTGLERGDAVLISE